MIETTASGTIDIEPPEEQIDSIYHELDLALQWKRPSILFAIYGSSLLRRTAQDALEQKILKSGQEVVHYQIEYDSKIDLTTFITEIDQKKSSVFYIDPLNSEKEISQISNLITMLNSCREYLVDHLVRVVFWLTEKEALSVAHQAPDFWASRHRVFEFCGDGPCNIFRPNSEVDSTPLEKSGKVLKSSRRDDDGIKARESALVFDLSEDDEPNISGINILLMLGVSNWKDGNLEKAFEPLKSALAIAEKSGNATHQAMVHKAMALVKTDSGDLAGALQSYQQVVILGQADATIWNNIGQVNLKAGKYDDAQEAFKSAIKADSEDPISWNGLGSAFSENDQFEEAISCYRKAIQLNSAFVTPWVKLADVLKKQNRPEDALYAYMRTIEMDNKNVHAWSEIGGIYLKAGSFEQAIDAYKKALILGDGSENLAENLAQAYSQAGHYEEAVPLYLQAIDQKQESSEKGELWNALGDVYRRLDNYEKAVAAYEMGDRHTTSLEELTNDKMMNDRPADEDAKLLDKSQDILSEPSEPAQETVVTISPVAEVETHVENPDQVESPEEQKVETDQNPSKPVRIENAQLWEKLGNTYLKARAVERAIEAYQKAIGIDPTNGQRYKRLAKVYTQKAELGEAVSLYQKSTDLLADDREKAATFSQIGELQRQMKDYSSSMDAFDSAIELDPDNPEFIDGLAKIQEDLDRLSDFPAVSDLPEFEQLKPASGVAEPQFNPQGSESSATISIEPTQAVASQISETPVAVEQTIQMEIPINIDLNNANVWNEIGNIFSRSGSLDDAVTAYRRAIELHPESGWSYCNLAQVYGRQGKRDLALSMFTKSIELLEANSDKATAWNRLGDFYRQADQYNDAIQAYQQADQLVNNGAFVAAEPKPVSEQNLFTHFVS